MFYWANIDNVKVGPLEPEQLAKFGLTPETYVWREGWSQWCKAKFVDELHPWIAPPYGDRPMNGYGTDGYRPDAFARERPQMPPTYLPWSLIVTFLCCMPTGIVAIIYSSMVESRYTKGNLKGARSASDTARWWCIGSAVLGALKYIGIFIRVILFH